MAHAVAWTIESALRSRAGKIAIVKDSVVAEDDNNYTVTFIVNDSPVTSKWTNEYGIWRIRAFGDFAAGDKQFGEKKKKEDAEAKRLVTEPSGRFSINYVNIFDPSATALGLDLKSCGGYFSFGFQGFFGLGKKHTQIEVQIGGAIPLAVGKVAFFPFADVGVGLLFLPKLVKASSYEFDDDHLGGISLKGGVMFTTAAVPGLYLQAAYQYGFYKELLSDDDGRTAFPNMLIVGIGYSW